MDTYYEIPKQPGQSYMILQGRVSTPAPNSLLNDIATSKPIQELPKAVWKFNKAFADLMISSLGFVSALTWSNYLSSLFQKGGSLQKVGNQGLLWVAIFITIVSYIGTVLYTSMYPSQNEIAKKPNPIQKSLETAAPQQS